MKNKRKKRKGRVVYGIHGVLRDMKRPLLVMVMVICAVLLSLTSIVAYYVSTPVIQEENTETTPENTNREGITPDFRRNSEFSETPKNTYTSKHGVYPIRW